MAARRDIELPPKPGGEPKIELGGFTAEMALNLPTQSMAPRHSKRSEPEPETTQAAPRLTQLGLFDAPAVATVPAKRILSASPRVTHF